MACCLFTVLKRISLKRNLTFRTFSVSICKNSPLKSTQSSLLISGKRAENTFVVVIPHLEFDSRFADLTELEENIRRRKLDLNVTEMKESWDFYKDWNEKKLKLQENLSEAGKRLGDLLKLEDGEEKKKELEKVERYRNLLKDDLQHIKKNVWSLEDNVIGELLNLPNVLHPKAPESDEELFLFDKENSKDGINHLQVGVKLNCLEYRSSFIYFIKNNAAIFELAVTNLFISKFSENGFTRFSNPDFTRNVLAEGVGIPPDNSSELFLLEETESNNDHLHLCGGASLFPFCGFLAKQSVPKQSLPLKFIAGGRHYKPVTSSMPGLYSVNQSTSVQVFIATFSEEELYNEFQSCIKILTNIFSDLGLKFRIVNRSPHCFKNWESLQVSFQVFSPYEKVFVEVGSVSLVGDFISKRLRMCYSGKGEPFLQVLSATVVNAQTLLALCLERSQDCLFIPDILKDFMIKTSN